MARGRALVMNTANIEAGATVVIGQGEPERSRAYAEKYGLPCPILCDPRFQAYEAFGLLEGTPAQILFDAPDAFLRCDYDAGLRKHAGRWAINGAAPGSRPAVRDRRPWHRPVGLSLPAL
jgi:hypothetical protein